MKTIKSLKLMRKFLILSVMIIGAFYVASIDPYPKVEAAAPCCQDCPGEGDPGNLLELCLNECDGVLYGSCYNSCFQENNACYMSCVHCSEGGPSPSYCSSNSQCNTWANYYCVNGFCSYSSWANACNEPAYSCPPGSSCEWTGSAYFCVD
jgi:hypothetical protein